MRSAGRARSTASARGCSAIHARRDRARPRLSPSSTATTAADLIDLVRHDLGLAKNDNALSEEATCLAIYSRAVNAEAPLDEVLARLFPVVRRVRSGLAQLFDAYVEAKQRRPCSTTTICCSTGRDMMDDAGARRRDRRPLRPRAGRRVPGHQRLQARSCSALKPDGRGLTVVGDDAQSIYSLPRGDGAQHPRLPGRSRRRRASSRWSRTTARRSRSSTPPNAVIGLAARALHQEPVADRHSAQRPRLVTVADEIGAGATTSSSACSRSARRACRSSSRRCCSAPSHHCAPLEVELARRNIPFVKFGGLKFLEAAHVKDVLAVLRWGENPRDRVAGFRVLQLLPGVGPASASALLDRMAEAADADRVRCARHAARPRRRATGRRCRAARRACDADSALAGPARPGARLVPAAPRARFTMMRRCARAISTAGADRRQLPLARALPHRAHARPAATPPATRPARRCSTRTT